MEMKATATGNDYVKYEAGSRKWWRSLLFIFAGSVRVSKRKFNKAGEASAYKNEMLARLERMK
jgi:hypothetical protein